MQEIAEAHLDITTGAAGLDNVCGIPRFDNGDVEFSTMRMKNSMKTKRWRGYRQGSLG